MTAWLGSKMRVILQSEAAECGLATLAMVAQHHGHKVDLPGLRQRYSTTIKGMTLERMMAIASDLALAPRAVRLELGELRQLALPAILHWDLNHFVVLETVSSRGLLTILDPMAGRRRISPEQASPHFTGVALELAPTSEFKPIRAQTRVRLTDLWDRITSFRGSLVQVFVLSLVLQATGLLAPFYVERVVDDATARGDVGLLGLLAIGFALVYLLNAITRALRDWIILALGQSLSFYLAGNVVRHLMRLPVPYFERRHLGDILSRVGSTQPIQALLSRGLVSAVIDAVLVLTTLAIMVMISGGLTALVVVSTLLYMLIGQLLYPALRLRSEEEIHARANEQSFLMETIRSIRAVKLHGSEAQREAAWRSRYADVISASYQSSMTQIRIDFSEGLLSGLSFVAVVYFGAMGVIAGHYTIGMLLAFLAYRSNFAASATALVQQWQRWRLIGLHLERLADIVTEPKENFPSFTGSAAPGAPSIRIEDLTFHYEPGDKPVIARGNLEIPGGSLVAIVGPSGAGKSTLVRLMLGLLPPSSGKILVNEVPLGPANMSAWRARVAAVLQDDVLLTGTLSDNIAFFAPTVDDCHVEESARQACIHDDILRMPMGYQSLVGDMGAALSAGQRQRILLARALYRNPSVLFLDEGTANLDPATEDRVSDVVAGLAMTRIVIAHRPALVERADWVIELRDGGLHLLRSPEGTTPLQRSAGAR